MPDAGGGTQRGDLQALIFDLDGLLVDSEPLYRDTFLEAAGAAGRPVAPEAYADLVGKRSADARDVLRRLLGGGVDLDAFVADWLRRFREAIREGRLRWKPGARELLEVSEKWGLPRALATSTTRPEALETLGEARRHFQVLVTGDEVRRGKPDPETIHLAASRLGVPASRCVVLEDSPAGAGAALAAGARLLLVPDEVDPPAWIRAGAEAVCRDLYEARRRIAAMLGFDQSKV